jgi:putative intracellular protease/amidase
VSEQAVVFVAFDGVQPIDVVGPHEVFANAGDAAASVGAAAIRHEGASA